MVGLLHPFRKVNKSWDRRALDPWSLYGPRAQFSPLGGDAHAHTQKAVKSQNSGSHFHIWPPLGTPTTRDSDSGAPFSHWMCGQPIVMHDALLCARVLYARYSAEVEREENVHHRPTSQQHFDLLQPERNNNAFNLIPAL
jgi:hypothetical protein